VVDKQTAQPICALPLRCWANVSQQIKVVGEPLYRSVRLHKQSKSGGRRPRLIAPEVAGWSKRSEQKGNRNRMEDRRKIVDLRGSKAVSTFKQRVARRDVHAIFLMWGSEPKIIGKFGHVEDKTSSILCIVPRT